MPQYLAVLGLIKARLVFCKTVKTNTEFGFGHTFRIPIAKMQLVSSVTGIHHFEYPAAIPCTAILFATDMQSPAEEEEIVEALRFDWSWNKEHILEIWPLLPPQWWSYIGGQGDPMRPYVECI